MQFGYKAFYLGYSEEMQWSFLSLIFISLLLGSSCSGYRVKKNKNPFSSYGVRSVAIPMFLNRSSLSNVSGPFTREISLLLSENVDLKVYGGEDKKADAILIGIIDSASKRSEVLRTRGTKFTAGGNDSSIGNRNQFFVPISTDYRLNLHLVLIKRPDQNDIKLIHSKWGKSINRHPKVIFNEYFDLNGNYSQVVNEDSSIDEGGVVNSTKNKAFFLQSVESLAKSAARNFKEVVLDAF